MIYFDNISSTKPHKIVAKTLANASENYFGDTLSVHGIGRKAKIALEDARQQTAKYFNTKNTEIVFTSSGIEAIQTVINSCIKNYKINNIIYFDNDFPEIINIIKHYEKYSKVEAISINQVNNGEVDFKYLDKVLNKNSLVVFPHADSQTGNLLKVSKVRDICKKNKALFLLDTSLTFGLYDINLDSLDIDFMTVSCHKFHSPKGVGILYVNPKNRIEPLLHGDSREYGQRAGVENLPVIVTTAAVLNEVKKDIGKNRLYAEKLKLFFITKAKEKLPKIKFNSQIEKRGLAGFVNILIPRSINTEMFVEKLDINNIAVSYGISNNQHISVRFMFGIYNNTDEIDYCINTMKKLL